MKRPRNSQPQAVVWDRIKADYTAAKASRFRKTPTGISAHGSSADYHYRSESDYLRLIEYAREADRNNMLVGQGVNRVVSNVLQDTGIQPDPITGDGDLDTYLLGRWNDWATDANQCDVAGELTFLDQQRLVLRHTIIDGDICVLLLNTGALQQLEAHRLRTPSATVKNVINGVELDQNRRRIKYWFTKEDINSWQTLKRVGDTIQVDARDADGHRQVLHCYFPERSTQTRGITAFARIMDALGMHDDIQLAALVKQQVASCITFMREKKDDYGMPGQTGARTYETQSDGSQRVIDEIMPGMEIIGAPGETLSGFSPNIPSAEFFQQATMILGIVAVNLGMPLAVLLLDPSNTNFSGWRGAMDLARRGFRDMQTWMVNFHNRPIYMWRMRYLIATDPFVAAAYAKIGDKIFQHRWNAPSWAYIQPLDDASADLLRVQNGLISPRRLHAERGRDWEEIYTETVEDNGWAIAAALKRAEELNKEFPGANIHWRELLSLPSPAGIKISLPSGESGTGTGSEKGTR